MNTNLIISEINNYKPGIISQLDPTLIDEEIQRESQYIVDNSINSYMVSSMNDGNTLIELLKEGNLALFMALLHLKHFKLNVNISDINDKSLLQYFVEALLEEEQNIVYMHNRIDIFFNYHYQETQSDRFFISSLLRKFEGKRDQIKLILLCKAYMSSSSTIERKVFLNYKNTIGFLTCYLMGKKELCSNYNNQKELFHYLLKKPQILPVLLPVLTSSKTFRQIKNDISFQKSVLKAVCSSNKYLTDPNLQEVSAFQRLFPTVQLIEKSNYQSYLKHQFFN
jgi:hypothetical protein